MGEILEINGPIVTVRLPDVLNGEQIELGEMRLVGEVIGREQDRAIAQVYESTDALAPGEPATALGRSLSVELGPGLLGRIFDGIQRPLDTIRALSGDHIARGLTVPALDRERAWDFRPLEDLQPGTRVSAGQILGTVRENASIDHPILVPPDLSGELQELAPPGSYRVTDPIARIGSAHGDTTRLTLMQQWPVRTPRPYLRREHSALPLITGQRILDTFFPLLKGSKGAIPGPFGAGKTILQQQIARWVNADIVVYVGCGERGNELVDLLDSFPRLNDPRTGRSLMERTLLVANTSNMPVVAREASIYVGITMAEYYRDLGYDVVMVADSTSRWAEALREVAARLGQMPVEEGYPAYLASRLASFYERAGRVQALGGRTGSITLIGAVSPPGGDFSEPVTSHTKDNVQTYWALSKELADARHYPAVDWVDSFSGDVDRAAQWWSREVNSQWLQRRAQALALLDESEELARIVNLVGPEALSASQRWVLRTAALLKEGLLQQNALDPVDSYCSPRRQFLLLDLLLEVFEQGQQLLAGGVPVQQLLALPLLARAVRLKSTHGEDRIDDLGDFRSAIREAFTPLLEEYGMSAESEP